MWSNAIAERWIGSVRREVLDRMLIINAAHLRKVLSEYESHFNGHRPHRALNHASPLRALPDPVDATPRTLGVLIVPGCYCLCVPCRSLSLFS